MSAGRLCVFRVPGELAADRRAIEAEQTEDDETATDYEGRPSTFSDIGPKQARKLLKQATKDQSQKQWSKICCDLSSHDLIPAKAVDDYRDRRNR